MNTRGLGYLVVAFVFTLFGLFVGKSEEGVKFKKIVSHTGIQIRDATLDTLINQNILEAKSTLFMENPEILDTLMSENLFSRERNSIKQMFDETAIIPISKHSWQIKLKNINASLFETDEGLVLIDSGTAPSGPAIVKAIKSVSDKPLHTLIYTQGDTDHAYGSWALLEAGWNPEIVAHSGIVHRFEKFIQLRNSLNRIMNQPSRNSEDIILPTLTFNDSLDLKIGGEIFTLKHHKGRHDDQLYVWIPTRKTLIAADFLEQREKHIKEQIDALREMEEFDAHILIPSHGEALVYADEIRDNLIFLADSLESIRNQTIVALNEGKGKAEIINSLQIYPSPIDAKRVSEAVMKRYSGFAPPFNSEQAAIIALMAGGANIVAEKAGEIASTNIILATRVAEWAYLADPENFLVQQRLIDTLKLRLTDPSSSPKEIVNYIDLMAEARARQVHSRSQ